MRDKFHIKSYELLGLNYFIKIGNTNYKLYELTDEQLNKLIVYNLNHKEREYADEMLFIFNDVRVKRRKDKRPQIYSVFPN